MSSKVYFTEDISSNGLLKVFNALDTQYTGKVGIKMSTGEPPHSNYLRPALIKDFIQSFPDVAIVECNTAYAGARNTTDSHVSVIKDHGFLDICDVDILDAEGDIQLPVTNGYHLKHNYIGKSAEDYDFFVVLSHFKGHAMAGYGGALKQISIGFASSRGKCNIHSSGTSMTSIDGDHNSFLESMADACKTYVDNFGEKTVYINVMNNLSIDCDCDGYPAEPQMDDIGIAASYDPVALDQFCIDSVKQQANNEALLDRINSRNGLHTIECCERLGVGTRKYEVEKLV